MPCYSTLTATKIVDLNRLLQALKALKIDAKQVNKLTVQTAVGNFTRDREGQAFIFDGGQSNLSPIGRQYAELSVKAFAIKKGFAIQSQDKKQVVLVKR